MKKKLKKIISDCDREIQKLQTDLNLLEPLARWNVKRNEYKKRYDKLIEKRSKLDLKRKEARLKLKEYKPTK